MLQNELYNFSGIVAASAGLLSSLAFNYSSQKDDEFLFLLFQSIVFCRPDNPLVLQTLSDFLLQISKNEMASGVINRLCCNSAVAAFVTNRKYKIIRFKNCKYFLINIIYSIIKFLNFRLLCFASLWSLTRISI